MRRQTDTDKLKVKPQAERNLSPRSNHGTTPPSSVPEGFLWLGQIGRPHGVRGAFFLKTEDNRTEWPGYTEVQLGITQAKTLKVEKTYLSGGKLAVQLEGVSVREDVESLYNTHLFVSRNQIQLAEEEYLVAELVDCIVEVEGREGNFGRVVALHDFGAQETLEILPNGATQTIFYPFIEKFILSVDEQAKKIRIVDEPAFLDEQNQ